jgi:hypothetical protein
MQHVCLQLPGFLGTALERAAQPKGQEGMGTGYFPPLQLQIYNTFEVTKVQQVYENEITNKITLTRMD